MNRKNIVAFVLGAYVYHWLTRFSQGTLAVALKEVEKFASEPTSTNPLGLSDKYREKERAVNRAATEDHIDKMYDKYVLKQK